MINMFNVKTFQELAPEDIGGDNDLCELLASLKYLRANDTPRSGPEALYETLCSLTAFNIF